MNDMKSKVLVVDDEPNNLQLVNQILHDQYQLSFANSGSQAIKLAKKMEPNLILLDIMMPEMDGYETCERLKSDPDTADIPVIFLTALDADGDEVRGFETGGVDFISKPAKAMILQARVRTHIELKTARDELLQQNKILKENERLRDDIDNITRHDLKGPLFGMINFPKLISKNCDLPEKYQTMLGNIVKLAYKMLNMINLSLDTYKMETGLYQHNPQPVDLLPIIDDIINENGSLMKLKKIAVHIEPDSGSEEFIVPGEQLLFYSMLSNTIKNAIEASPEGKTVLITLEKKDDTLIRIHNQGVIPEEIRGRFFEKYVTAGKEKGTGLGTYSARLIAETLNGSVSFESSDSFGTEITFKFPK